MCAKLRKATNLFNSRHVIYILILEILLGFIISIGSFYIFNVILSTVLARETVLFDTSVTAFLISLRNPYLTALMKFLSFLGMPFTFGAIVLVALLLIWRSHTYDAFLFSCAVVWGNVISMLLKVAVGRPRPLLHSLVYEDTYSFPSAHSMNSFVFYIFFVFIIYRYTRNKTVGILSLFGTSLLIVLIGISRVYLGVHYPSDILGGYLVGALWVSTILIFDRIIYLSKYLRSVKN